MERYEFEVLGRNKTPMTVTAEGPDDKTLLFGETTVGWNYHLYQQRGELHKVVYNGRGGYDHESERVMNLSGLMSVGDSGSARVEFLRPEYCDWAFCMRLKGMGVDLPFVGFDDEQAARLERQRKPFFALTELDLMLGETAKLGM